MHLLTDWAQLVTRPFAALPMIHQRRRLRDGLLALTLALALPALVGEIGALGPYRPAAPLASLPQDAQTMTDLFARWSYQQRFRLPVLGVVAGVVLWLVAALLIHAVARALRGRGSFSGYLTLVGYVAAVGLATLPLSLLNALLEASGRAAPPGTGSTLLLLAIAVFAWQNVLLVVAAQKHYGISAERATTAVLGPVGLLVIVLTTLLVVVTLFALVLKPVAAG